MDREKAIQVLKRCEAESHCNHYKQHYCCIGCGQREALNLAIEALEKLQLSPETSTNDLISRQAAIEAVEKAVFKGVAKSSIESLPPVNQKQITDKLKNPCDSLLTEDSEGVKEQKSKLDCISRADAINVRCAHCDTRDCCRDCSEVEILLSLPPVTPTERMVRMNDKR